MQKLGHNHSLRKKKEATKLPFFVLEGMRTPEWGFVIDEVACQSKNPSLSARNQEQRKLLLILFYVDTGSLLTSRHIKQNQHKHRQVVADFLHRSPKQGWASKAKPIPTPTTRPPAKKSRNMRPFKI